MHTHSQIWTANLLHVGTCLTIRIELGDLQRRSNGVRTPFFLGTIGRPNISTPVSEMNIRKQGSVMYTCIGVNFTEERHQLMVLCNSCYYTFRHSQHTPFGNFGRLLLIDNNPDFLHFIRFIFESHGFEVVTASMAWMPSCNIELIPASSTPLSLMNNDWKVMAYLTLMYCVPWDFRGTSLSLINSLERFSLANPECLNAFGPCK